MISPVIVLYVVCIISTLLMDVSVVIGFLGILISTWGILFFCIFEVELDSLNLMIRKSGIGAYLFVCVFHAYIQVQLLLRLIYPAMEISAPKSAGLSLFVILFAVNVICPLIVSVVLIVFGFNVKKVSTDKVE